MYLFDDYTLDTQLYELRHAGILCPLEPQVFDILLHLIQHRDRVVSREELLEYVWPERFISEATLDHRVMEARQAIGDSGQRQGRIKTLRGRGYRFVASVEEGPVAEHRAWHTPTPQIQGAPWCVGVLTVTPLHTDARFQQLSINAIHQEPAVVGSPAVLVGLHAELTQLQQWYTAALQGMRQVVCVTGLDLYMLLYLLSLWARAICACHLIAEEVP